MDSVTSLSAPETFLPSSGHWVTLDQAPAHCSDLCLSGNIWWQLIFSKYFNKFFWILQFFRGEVPNHWKVVTVLGTCPSYPTLPAIHNYPALGNIWVMFLPSCVTLCKTWYTFMHHSNAKVLVWTCWGCFPRAVVTQLEEKGMTAEGHSHGWALEGVVIPNRWILPCRIIQWWCQMRTLSQSCQEASHPIKNPCYKAQQHPNPELRNDMTGTRTATEVLHNATQRTQKPTWRSNEPILWPAAIKPMQLIAYNKFVLTCQNSSYLNPSHPMGWVPEGTVVV